MEDIVDHVYNQLKFCPECGKRLERNPISGNSACLLHGDFRQFGDEIQWDFTKNLIRRDHPHKSFHKGMKMSCDKCGSATHRDDAMNRRCNKCEYKVRQCICKPRIKLIVEVDVASSPESMRDEIEGILQNELLIFNPEVRLTAEAQYDASYLETGSDYVPDAKLDGDMTTKEYRDWISEE